MAWATPCVGATLKKYFRRGIRRVIISQANGNYLRVIYKFVVSMYCEEHQTALFA
jgi:hypothetical protein